MVPLAAQWAADVVDGDVAAVVRDGVVLAGAGVRAGTPLAAALVHALAGATAASTPVDLPGLPGAWLADGEVTDGLGRTQLVVARAGEGGFEAAERLLVLGTGRLLGESLRTARAFADERAQRRRSDDLAVEREALLATLRERELLLSTLLVLQRAISHRRPLEEVLDLLCEGAQRVLGGLEAAVVLEDPLHRDRLRVGARRGTAGHAGCEDLLAHARTAVSTQAWASGADGGCRWEAAPVHASGRVVGALVLLDRADRRSPAAPAHAGERSETLLTTFTQHASVALTDAYTEKSLRESFYDQLTRLPNRSLFLDRLERAATGHARGGPRAALLYLDLDGFKAVNDRYGHGAGDAVLQACAARLRDCLRPGDTAARLGGDEFAVVLEDADVPAAEEVAHRVLAALCEPVVHEGHLLEVGCSIGVAAVGHAGTTAETLLRDADTAMYVAKAAPATSRPAVRTFQDSVRRARAERLELEVDLADAVPGGQLVLHYQPTVRLSDGAPAAVEALVRWQHPRLGLLAPDRFIGIAEQSGHITALGRWVLGEACRQVAAWRAEGMPLTVAVNLASAQLVPGLVGEVQELLRTHRLPGHALVLEITETVVVADGSAAQEVLAALRTLDVRVAVDDFGTGYSSLSYLQRLPVDVLKVDRSFVTALGRGGDPALVRTVLSLADALGLDSVAEGIETAEERDVLRALGCTVGQGYLWSRPLPPAQLRTWWLAADAAARPATPVLTSR
nr:EAL domain-containing protein [Kineococcus siccus]